jgi:hypothetical protein
MRNSEMTNRSLEKSLERRITTDMSANIVAQLMKQKWTAKRIAGFLDVPVEFVEGVRSRKQVFTWRDLKKIASHLNTTRELLFLNSIDVRPGLEPLFDSVRHTLELAATPVARRSRPRPLTRKRRSSKKAA